MPAVQCCVLVFTALSASSGVQTVTGVVDADGNHFIGRTFMFYNGAVANNALAYGTAFGHAYAFNGGIDMSDGRGSSVGTAETSQFGVKICSEANGYGYSVLDTGANAFFGGDVNRVARVTAVRNGEFDLTYPLNNISGDSIICVVLGGDDLNIDLPGPGQVPTAGQTITTTDEPAGVLFPRGFDPISTPPAYGYATGAGGVGGTGIGWASRVDGAQAAMHILVQSQGGNGRYQRTDKCAVNIDSNFMVAANEGTVASWGVTSYTMGPGVTSGIAALAFSGSGVAARSGSLTQPLAGGSQTISTGILPRLIILASYGAAASTSLRTDQAEIALGFCSANAQAGYWTGETATSPAVLGARYLSDTTALRFAAANAGSTNFTAIASFVGITDYNGTFTINWDSVDGVQREVLWFVLGESTLPPPPNPPLAGCTPYLPN